MTLIAASPVVAQLPPIRPPAGVAPGSPLPGIVTPSPPAVAPGLPARPSSTGAAPVPPGMSQAIGGVTIDGVTAFDAASLRAITNGLIGPAVSDGQIETARRALSDLYRREGYVYTTVRAKAANGTLRFQVVEGYVADVRLDGDVGPAGTQVLRFLNHLVNQRPLSARALERWLLLASDIPGLTVRSTLNPSAGEPGALTLIARVSRKAVSGQVSADNRAAPFDGPEQGIATVSFDSFTEFGERTELSFYAAPGPNIFGQASTEFYLGGSGLRLRLYGGAGPAIPTGALHAIGYEANTREFGGTLAYPLIRAREQTLNLSLAFDAIETETDTTLGPGGSSLRASYDSLRIIRLGAEYGLLDTLLGGNLAATDDVSLRVSHGLDGLGSAHNGNVTKPPPRLGEKVDFTKISGELSRNQPLFHPYQNATVALVGSLGWQATGDLLPPVEKYYLGGPHFNSGYYYGEVSGDQAVTFSGELQLRTPLPVPRLGRWPQSLQAQFYTFYDWGQAWQNTGLESNVVLQSSGGGVRLFVDQSAEIDLEGVWRGNLYPNGRGPDVGALRSAAFYWRALVPF